MNGKKHGFGKYKWPNGRKYAGYWENGKQHGIGRYILTDNTSKIGFWNKGKRVHWLTDNEIMLLENNEKLTRINTD